MITITVPSRQPAGGGWTMYLRYAGAAARYRDVPSEAETGPSALLIAGDPVRPSDGVMLASEDPVLAVRSFCSDGQLEILQQRLDDVQERRMEKWSNG